MKLRILALLFAVTMLFSLVACNKPNEVNPFEEKPPVEVRVQTLNGTTGFGMAKLMEDAENGAFEWDSYSFEVKSDATEILAALTSGTVDIAALPTNAASTIYNKTQGKVKILAINTLGCLFLLNGGSQSVSKISDLGGKTVYAPAQNPTFILTYLCQQNNLEVITEGTPTSAQVLIDSTSYAKPDALRDAVASKAVDLAVLPEPMVTIAVSKAKAASHELKVAVDLTKEWDKLPNKKDTLVQGCVVVRNEFLEANPSTVNRFLEAYKQSIQYLNENVDEAALLIKEHEIFANDAIAKQAIPKCNVKFVAGDDMKTAVSAYLEILKSINPQSIGGNVPAEDFYYNANK